MKRPDEAFGDVAIERRCRRGHDIAVVEAFEAWLFDLQSRGMRQYEVLAARFKSIAYAWNRSGSSQVNVLREALRHEYPDSALGR